MTVLVTGHEGFIGGALAERLAAMGVRYCGIDKRSGGSTADFGLLRFVATGCDTIIHLGASCSSPRSLREPADDFTDNLVGTFNVCEVARLTGARVIFTSSVKVYPGDDGKLSPYGLSKRTGEDYLAIYGSLYGVRSLILRPSTVYGPTQNGSSDGGWFTWFIRAAAANKPIVIHGTGLQSRDVLYIDDFIDLLVALLVDFPDASGTFDVGGGRANEVALLELLDALDYDNVTHEPALPADLKNVITDNSPLDDFDWAPAVGWREGMRRVQEAL